MYQFSDAMGESLLEVPVTWTVAAGESPPARIAWLRKEGCQERQALEAMRLLVRSGFSVRVMNSEYTSPEGVICFDLIVFEVNGMQIKDFANTLCAIRVTCQAPLLVLVPDVASECSLTALEAGADASLTLSTPAEIVFARSKALLRRWLQYADVTAVS